MTVEDAKNKILVLLLKSDTVTSKEIYATILNDKEEQPPYAKEIFDLAVKSLEEQGLIKKLLNEEVWVLDKPLISYPQTVTINGRLAIAMADTVNEILKEFLLDGITPINPYNITQEDLETVVSLLIQITKK